MHAITRPSVTSIIPVCRSRYSQRRFFSSRPNGPQFFPRTLGTIGSTHDNFRYFLTSNAFSRVFQAKIYTLKCCPDVTRRVFGVRFRSFAWGPTLGMHTPSQKMVSFHACDHAPVVQPAPFRCAGRATLKDVFFISTERPKTFSTYSRHHREHARQFSLFFDVRCIFRVFLGENTLKHCPNIFHTLASPSTAPMPISYFSDARCIS